MMSVKSSKTFYLWLCFHKILIVLNPNARLYDNEDVFPV